MNLHHPFEAVHATGKRSRRDLEQELLVKVALMEKSCSDRGFQYEGLWALWLTEMTNMMVEQSQRVVQHYVISFPVRGPLKLLRPQELKHAPHMRTTSIQINMKNAEYICLTHAATLWPSILGGTCGSLPLSLAKHHSVCGVSLHPEGRK